MAKRGLSGCGREQKNADQHQTAAAKSLSSSSLFDDEDLKDYSDTDSAVQNCLRLEDRPENKKREHVSDALKTH